mmetsp:Transcript_11129/g.24525  ORF Transcript_11129/g.24525 Transcript_11129/m.24525 type:complete len:236 (+) Transcript_11129:290-997(+)
MMFHLKVESSRKTSGNKTPIGRRSLHLRLEPAHLFSGLFEVSRRITIRIDEVVRQREEHTESETLADSHQHDDSKGRPAQTIVHEGADNVQVNVHHPQCNGVLPPLDNEIILHLNSDVLSPTLTKINELRIEYSREPVKSKHEEEVPSLEPMPPLSLRVSNGIVIECKHRFRAEAIGILLTMVSVSVMSPMLCHPIPFVRSNQIRSKSQQVIHPGTLTGSSVIGIVLDIQPNECL